MKNILILGHKGYVGSNLKLFLENKSCNIFILRNRSNNILRKNIHKINIIINCAGENYKTSLMNKSNFSYVKKILKFIKKYNKNIFFINLSSCSVYGENFHKKNIWIDENTTPKPISFYAISKLNADLLINKAYENRQIKNYAIIRAPQIISPDMKSTSYIRLIEYVKKNLFFYISNSNSVRNYVHINDLINFIWFICKNKKVQNKKNKLFIISRHIKLSDLINYIKKKKKINSEQLILPKFFVICLSRLINFFYPKFPLSQGIIESLTSDVIVRSNIKNFKYNFHINYDYINFIIK